MRRLFVVLGVALAIPFVLFLVWDTQTRTLGNTLLADISAGKQRTIKRDPPLKEPKHDNGFKCLGGMLDVSPPGALAPFTGKNIEALEPFINGTRPVNEIPPEVRASMIAFSPWAGGVRDCAQSKELSFVEGIAPWAPVDNVRAVRLAETMPALIDFTRLELRVLIADGQPEVALERCSTTWALAADQTHLGLAGAKTARLAVKWLAPACTDAVKALPAEATPVREAVGKQWLALKQRLALPKEVVEAERIRGSLRTFAWVSDEAIRKQLPAVVMPANTGFMARIEAGRKWRAYDQGMRELTKESPSGPVDASLPTALNDYEQTADELDALAALASK